MHIRLRNEIDMDDQKEILDQVYPVQVTMKKDQLYLVFTNEEDEKVVIKANPSELVMTRFSNPNSVMRFLSNQEAVVTIPTPMGLQHLVTDTSRYDFCLGRQSIRLDYQLKPYDTQQIFASYKMTIIWE
ncbi:DUF1934 domain-containing protein [Streptococcus sp. X16XC17]|uniref:DUF1934 domain-containing protein n=1 Tax=unclassified Streptococcus TaxID=2608887 RepID=UPI00066FD2B8|nr:MULTISPECIES: DUF1934 domain-containing protein [unclassified Streptococcus]TCD46697.1 DUF1934 domain-containing protein [Streptococcus sp. X16XC17]